MPDLLDDVPIKTGRRALKPRKIGDYAHFAGGTEAPGAVCKTCANVVTNKSEYHRKVTTHYRCGKAAEFRDCRVEDLMTIQPHTPGCKYWERQG